MGDERWGGGRWAVGKPAILRESVHRSGRKAVATQVTGVGIAENHPGSVLVTIEERVWTA